MSTEGGSTHQPQDNSDEPETFHIQILPAGTAPKKDTFQPNVKGDLAPGQPNNTASSDEFADHIDVKKGLGSDVKNKDGVSKVRKERAEDRLEHRLEIKGASEMEPEGAESL